MRRLPKLFVASLVAVLALVGCTSTQDSGKQNGGAKQESTVSLKHWPAKQAKQLGRTIAANTDKHRYATFDADNTIWNHDLEESLLPFMEQKGAISRKTIDSSLKLIPFKPHESLYSYYQRLCEIDNKVCYPWIAQVFSGHSLKELKGYVDKLMRYGKPIRVTYYDGGKLQHDQVRPPKIYPGQRELLQQLAKHGIKVYVVTAAQEELVRMVVSDPHYGLGVKPDRVIGVTTLLKDPHGGRLTTARKQIDAGHFLDKKYPKSKHLSMKMTPYLSSPQTWYEGKKSAIEAFIAPYSKPIVAGGDSESDWSMLFDVDVANDGSRVWVDRGKYNDKLAKDKRSRAADQRKAGIKVDTHRGWVSTPKKGIDH